MHSQAGFFFLCLALSTAVGLGPACFLVRRCPDRWAFGAMISPIVGLMAIGLMTVNLVILDFTVGELAYPLLGGMTLVSLILLAAAHRSDDAEPSVNAMSVRAYPRTAGIALLGFSITLIFLLAPAMLGGFGFTVFRINPWDAFNYIQTAEIMGHFRRSDLAGLTAEQLIQIHPILGDATWFVNDRGRTVAGVLSLFCRIADVRAIFVHHAYAMVYFAASFPLIWILAAWMGIGPWMSCGLAAGSTVGFMGAFILDSNAMSTVSTVPILLLCIIGGIRFLNASGPQTGGTILPETCLLAFVLASLFYFYVELVPIVFGMFAIGFLSHIVGIRARDGGRAARRALIRQMAWVALLTAVLILPVIVPFYRHFHSEIQQVILSEVPWADHFFRWLEPDVWLAGFWGLTLLDSGFLSDPVLHSLSHAAALVISIGMTVLLFGSWGMWLRTRNVAIRLSIPLTFMLGLTWISMRLILHNVWASGKTLMYGHAVVYLSAAAFAAEIARHSSGSASVAIRFARKAALLIMSLWIAVQIASAAYRIDRAVTLRPYPDIYPVINPVYKPMFDLSAIATAARNEPGVIAVDVDQPWYAAAVNSTFPDRRLVYLCAVPNYNDSRGRPFGRMKSTDVFSSLIAPAKKYETRLGRTADVSVGHLGFFKLRPAEFRMLTPDTSL